MKKIAVSMVVLTLWVFTFTTQALGATFLVPVGQVIGLELSDDTVTVAAFDETLGARAQAAGLQIGDKLLSIDGHPIHCAQDVRNALDRSTGRVKLEIRRQERPQTLVLTPEITDDGPKLGIYLKQGVTGNGTVTWYDPQTGRFGALGHGVSEPGGKLLDMVSGRAYEARVASVRMGKVGQPGQLRGSADPEHILGQLSRNCERGIFGTCPEGFEGTAMEVASAEEIKTGPATILSTVSGDRVQEYSVEILKLYPRNGQEGRNLLLRVTDPRLLEATGGIVQGMSGSPIIQNGKLVGAVTHVLVNDPTTGYGIFIENMLEAAA